MLRDVEACSTEARERLFTVLYRELRQLAERKLHGSSQLSVSPTTLVHETYLSMCSAKATYPDKARFVGYAAPVMRHLIIDLVRERRALKRGAEFHITRLDTAAAQHLAAEEQQGAQLSELSQGLEELAQQSPRLAELVDLKYFCGMSHGDFSTLLGVSERTVERDWIKARLFLSHYR